MTTKKTVGAVAVVGALLLSAGVASAQVTSVQANLFTGANDTFFDGTTLTVNESSTLDLVTVNEDSPLSGFTNMSLSLTAVFDSVSNAGGFFWGKFINGTVDLQFDDGSNFYQLAGPVEVLLIKIDSAVGGATPFAQLSGEGLFKAATAVLPANATGIWPQMSPLLSSLKGLIFEVNQDLTSYSWETHGAWTGDAESLWQMIPNDSAVPEPAALVLLALGGCAILRRR